MSGRPVDTRRQTREPEIDAGTEPAPVTAPLARPPQKKGISGVLIVAVLAALGLVFAAGVGLVAFFALR